MKKKIVTLISCAYVIGCNNQVQEPEHQPQQRALRLEPSIIEGIKPSVDNNKFAAGSFISYDPNGFDGERFQFEHGVFVIRPNGHQMFILNSDAPNRLTEPVKDSAVSNEMFRSYLESRGAPKEQIGSFHVTTMKSGESTQENKFSEKFEGYISNCQRQIDGVTVADSIAWAKFRQDGTTVAESIYWPNLPSSIVKDIAEFRKALSESQVLNDKINKFYPASGLVIHHTSLSQSGAVQAVVTYDVLSSDKNRPRIININKEGQDLRLPWYEISTATGDPKEIKKLHNTPQHYDISKKTFRPSESQKIHSKRKTMKKTIFILMFTIVTSCDNSAEKTRGSNEGGNGGNGGEQSSGTGGESNKCPKYEPMDIHLQTPQTRDQCTSQGQTCTTNTGTNICRGIGEGTGFVEGKCTCDGTNWICTPHNLSKNNGCPLNPCGSIKPQEAPQTPKQNLLYCTPQNHTSCQTDSWEICPDGSKGQTVTWTCSCQENGSFTCTPELKNDVICP